MFPVENTKLFVSPQLLAMHAKYSYEKDILDSYHIFKHTQFSHIKLTQPKMNLFVYRLHCFLHFLFIFLTILGIFSFLQILNIMLEFL